MHELPCFRIILTLKPEGTLTVEFKPFFMLARYKSDFLKFLSCNTEKMSKSGVPVTGLVIAGAVGPKSWGSRKHPPPPLMTKAMKNS